MKFVFLLGGFAGFTLTALAGYLADHGADRVFFDAAVGCLCGALLFRWFWTVLVRGMREVMVQRHAAAAATATPKK
ncbi:MAG: hypothetical protein RLZZ15_1318 [Verrucomicrobiota bacterium]|jgi:hypothetical protein